MTETTTIILHHQVTSTPVQTSGSLSSHETSTAGPPSVAKAINPAPVSPPKNNNLKSKLHTNDDGV
jgi:hypothetical protein